MTVPVRFWLLLAAALSATVGSGIALNVPLVALPNPQATIAPLAVAQAVAVNDASNTLAAPALSNLSNFPHWQVSVVDRTSQSRDFSQFFQRLQTAVRDRDARFIRSIVTKQTILGGADGNSRPLSSFNIDNPKAPFWLQMEKALSKGCAIEQNSTIPNRDAGTSVWLCPNVLRAYETAQKNKPTSGNYSNYDHVVIIGENINIRKEAGTGAPVVGIVSNEIIQLDRATLEKLPQRMQQEMAIWNPDGWTPVILPNGKHGYVQNRYAYLPLGHRTIFVKSGGKWQLRAFVAGD